ncbi:hypothetical protein T265_04188 [Opisthorchis viverrini]|uniref:Uncharacterized protein n=1 Tax=Opisthorchis viverrini TaxID=6198 RepID=A0A075AGV3_OPIVI|nr:hypothetical protein T265_04188 [Opisthorchis viverrini]KER29094.1 hypothetical protein T265_04188 [Opisthorchis viverrini]
MSIHRCRAERPLLQGPSIRTDEPVLCASVWKATSAYQPAPTDPCFSKSIFKPRRPAYLAAETSIVLHIKWGIRSPVQTHSQHAAPDFKCTFCMQRRMESKQFPMVRFSRLTGRAREQADGYTLLVCVLSTDTRQRIPPKVSTIYILLCGPPLENA